MLMGRPIAMESPVRQCAAACAGLAMNSGNHCRVRIRSCLPLFFYFSYICANFKNEQQMSISTKLNERCGGTCELCNNATATQEYTVSPKTDDAIENQVAICDECLTAIDATDKGMHWRCLEGSIWNPEPAVQTLSYRILQQ